MTQPTQTSITRTCTHGRKIKIPLERIEDIEHLVQEHGAKFKLEPSKSSPGMHEQVFCVPESAWKPTDTPSSPNRQTPQESAPIPPNDKKTIGTNPRNKYLLYHENLAAQNAIDSAITQFCMTYEQIQKDFPDLGIGDTATDETLVDEIFRRCREISPQPIQPHIRALDGTPDKFRYEL